MKLYPCLWLETRLLSEIIGKTETLNSVRFLIVWLHFFCKETGRNIMLYKRKRQTDSTFPFSVLDFIVVLPKDVLIQLTLLAIRITLISIYKLLSSKYWMFCWKLKSFFNFSQFGKKYIKCYEVDCNDS